MSELIVVGRLNMDMVLRTSRLPERGETVKAKEIRYFPGGKGANQAAAAAKLGCHTTLVGKTGGDPYGNEIVNSIHQAGVNTEHIFIDDQHPTGSAVIIVDDQGENFIVVSEGANGNLTIQDIDKVETTIRKSKYALIQFETPIETVERVVDLAAAHKVEVILNPAPARHVKNSILNKVHYLVLNETELKALTNLSVVDLDSAQIAANQLIMKGVQVVIVTMGAKGALVVKEDGSKLIPAFNVDVVDTTAAGDAFIGGFCSGLLRQMNLIEAVQYGCAAGALASTKMGAQSSLPTRGDVDSLIKQAR